MKEKEVRHEPRIQLLSALFPVGLLMSACTRTPEPSISISDSEAIPTATDAITEIISAETQPMAPAVTAAPAAIEAVPQPTEIPEGEYVYLYLQEDAGWECTAEIPHINISPELDAMVNGDIDRLYDALRPLQFQVDARPLRP